MKNIPFTQYLQPDGKKRYVSIAVADDVTEMADSIMARGLSFECEVLTTGHVSVTITDREEGDMAIELVPNGPEVPKAVEKLIREYLSEAA